MDYQDGYGETYYGSSGNQSWSWKRGLGMDVVCYKGTAESRTIKHNLGVAPEMIWIKRRMQSGNSGDWMVGHKDLYGGTNPSITSTTLNGALLDDANGTGGSGTTITLTSVSGFSSSGGTLKVGEELITYTGVAGSTVTGIVRGASGSTRSAHNDGAVVQEASNFTGWGDASPTGEVTLEPGNWSLDNFGQILVATVKNNKTFQWNPSSASALSTRATVINNAPIPVSYTHLTLPTKRIV